MNSELEAFERDLDIVESSLSRKLACAMAVF